MARADRVVNSSAALREASGTFGVQTTMMASTLADQFAPPPPAPPARRRTNKKKGEEDVVGGGRGVVGVVGGRKRGPASYENMAVEVGPTPGFRQSLLLSVVAPQMDRLIFQIEHSG